MKTKNWRMIDVGLLLLLLIAGVVQVHGQNTNVPGVRPLPGITTSTNVPLLVDTNSVLARAQTNFFHANSALLNAEVIGGGGGQATNAIGTLNGHGTNTTLAGTTTLDKAVGTNFTGNAAGLTNLPEAGVSGLVSDLAARPATKGQLETLEGGRFTSNQFNLTAKAILLGDGALGAVASGNVWVDSTTGLQATNSAGNFPIFANQGLFDVCMVSNNNTTLHATNIWEVWTTNGQLAASITTNGSFYINAIKITGAGGGGTVTSVGASGPAGFTWSSAVTGSGTLTATTPSEVLTNGASQAIGFAGNLSAGTLTSTNLTGNSTFGSPVVFSNNVFMDAPHSLSLSNATASSIARFGAAHDVTNATVADLVAAFPSFPITNGQSQAFNVTGGATNTSAGGWAGNALSLTNVIGTNIVNPTTAFVSSSNSITLNNGYWTFNATTNVAITNIVGSVSGNATWAILSVSNSGAGTMAVYVTAANVRALGVLSTAANTNGIQVAGGKVAIVSVLGIGNQITNYLDCVQQ